MISLEKACFNLIVQKFEKFHTAFSVSHDQTLNRNFEFLQRKFSVELISEITKQSKLKDKYLDFLLNVHLKSLDEEWFKYSGYRDSIKDIICRLPSLTNLSLKFKCNDEILEKVAEFCPQIVEIEASYSSVTDTGLKYLCKNINGNIPCPELKEISIHSTSVTDEGLIHLIQDIPSLEDIHHGNVPRILYSMHKKYFPNLENLPTYNLAHLSLFLHKDLPYYTGLFKICLAVCPSLKSICCVITEKRQLNFFNNTRLEKLDIDGFTRKGKIDINNFLKNNGSNLESLSICNCRISVSVLAAYCPKLQYLCIQDSIFLDDYDDSQLSFHYLTMCYLTGTAVDSSTNKAICLLLLSSPNLERLEFRSCELSTETKTCILKCCDKTFLKYIAFYSTKIEVKLVKDIVLSSPSLEILDLQHCGYFLRHREELIEFVKGLTKTPDIYVDQFRINDYHYGEYADLH